ncbi:FAD dependent oxidoreductase-like protein [Delitschia confertaspora ATCC 74209]|uniref:FAD dependent oxidoreductase-like protein n=1 Tax=Delitschia confertaspora ATCC 74209 TaxID=1513339 RepID=A0A9P4JGM8_9PLEO|nr:FAD dependent oxidoreductase-like protein [Delitschia confertaspora ATCC 74209]
MEEQARLPVTLPVPNPTPSYWHIPKSPLSNHLHADLLPPTADFVIIGSGITGTLLAYNLLNALPDSNIVMLEAREVCSGATGRNGGHTKAASYREYLAHKEVLGKEEALRIARLEYQNILETHRLAEKENVNEGSYLCRTVDVVYDEKTFREGKKAIEALRADATAEEKKEDGMAWYRVYSAEEAQEKFFVSGKNQNPEVEGDEKLVGAFEYLAGRAVPYRIVTGILQSCIKRGLKLFTNTMVTKVTSVSRESTPLNAVWAPTGAIMTPNLIFATNGYTAHLLPEMQSLIVPLRGQMTMQLPGSSSTLPTPLPTTYSFIYKSGYEYMIARPSEQGSDKQQHVLIGGGLCRLPEGGANEYGTCDDGVLNDDISKYLGGTCSGYFGKESWGEGMVKNEWTGIMGATADGRPFVGRMPEREGVWICAGFNGHGMVLCLKSAEALVHMIRGTHPDAIEWFPKSFLMAKDRLRDKFQGRTDLKVMNT